MSRVSVTIETDERTVRVSDKDGDVHYALFAALQAWEDQLRIPPTLVLAMLVDLYSEEKCFWDSNPKIYEHVLTMERGAADLIDAVEASYLHEATPE